MPLTLSGNTSSGTFSGLTSTSLSVTGNISTLSSTGELRFYNVAGNNWALISSPKTAGDTEVDLKFTTKTGTMTLDASGNLLVGTTNPSATTGNGVKIVKDRGFSGYNAVSVVSDTTATTYSTYELYTAAGGAGYKFYVSYNGTISAVTTTISSISDQRLKENIRDLNVGLDAVMALKPRVFDWKEGKGKDIKNDRGFIAQEFEQVFPDLIDEWKDPAPEGEEPYKSVRADLIPVLVKAIQELKAELDTAKAEIDALKAGA